MSRMIRAKVTSAACSARSRCISRLKGIFAPFMRAVPERHHRQSAMKEKRNDRNMGAGHKACAPPARSEEHTSELQSLMRISYAVFCLKKKKINKQPEYKYTHM